MFNDSQPQGIFFDDHKSTKSDSKAEIPAAGPDGFGVDLHRGLKNRHIQMIALGGVIGTALFIGSGLALADGGPLGMFLGFVAIGSLVYSVMACVGEMIVHTPIAGGHIALANRYVGDSMSFAMGWFYWYLWVILFPTECTAVAILIGYWLPDVNPAAWVALSLFIILMLNSWSVRVYGESEFWFASLKIILIVGLILCSVIVTAGGNPKHEVIGFKFWKGENGPFQQYLGIKGSLGQFLGFWATLTRAAFGYVGCENVTLAAGEAKDPKNSMAKAIRRVWIRILIFFCTTIFVLTLVMPSSDPKLRSGTGTAASSPFVIAYTRVGITGLPSVINAGVLCSAASAGSAHCYLGSRALWALAYNGRAPKIFTRVNKYGTPYYCLAVSAALGLLGFTVGGNDTAYQVFDYFSTMVSIVGLISWAGIAFIYLRFYRATQYPGFDRSQLLYRARLQPFLGYYTLIFASIVVLFSQWKVFLKGHWSTSDFICAYLPVPLFFIAYFGHKFISKTKMIPLDEVDLYSHSKAEDFGPVMEPPKNPLVRFWQAIV